MRSVALVVTLASALPGAAPDRKTQIGKNEPSSTIRRNTKLLPVAKTQKEYSRAGELGACRAADSYCIIDALVMYHVGILPTGWLDRKGSKIPCLPEIIDWVDDGWMDL